MVLGSKKAVSLLLLSLLFIISFIKVNVCYQHLGYLQDCVYAVEMGAEVIPGRFVQAPEAPQTGLTALGLAGPT